MTVSIPSIGIINGPEPTYIGDSVYIVDNGVHIVIFTNNGRGPENIIYLDSMVVSSLLGYLHRTTGTTAPKPKEDTDDG